MGKKKGKSKSNNKIVETINPDKTLSDPALPKERVHVTHLLIWFDNSVDSNTNTYEQMMEQLQKSVPSVYFYDNEENCLGCIEQFDTTISIIISGSISDDFVRRIDSCHQVYQIYFYRPNPMKYSRWERYLKKCIGKYDRLDPICERLRHSTKQIHHNSTSITFLDYKIDETNENRNRLEASFMYTEIFKNILLSMDDEVETRKDFIHYARKEFQSNSRALATIDEFEKNYQSDRSIFWYTRDSFIYSMLNRALRTLQTDIIIMMGFFIRDMNVQIEVIHRNQSNQNPFIVYRGQHLSKIDLEKMIKTPNGLISFNNFLSTSRDRCISHRFAESSVTQENQVGVLFRIKIDPMEYSKPFANISALSYFHEEDEILFSMNTIFRIGSIQNVDEREELFQVDLTLTGDDDPDLRQVRQRIEEELGDGNPQERFGRLLIKMGQIDHAEQVYLRLMEKAQTDKQKSIYYHHLGVIKDQQQLWIEAIRYYQNSLQIEVEEENSESNQLNIATGWNNIGLCYENMKSYHEALDYYRKALDIRREFLPAEHSDLAQSYNNLGTIYYRQQKYHPANFFYKKSLEIKEKTLPTFHPSLAIAFNNIASIYFDTEKYDEALEHFNKALLIRKKTLPSNHPDIAQTLNNLGMVFFRKKNYREALSYYKEALRIQITSFPSRHSSIGNSYKNIGFTWISLKNYSKAVENMEKAVDILKDSASTTDSSIENLRTWIEKTKRKISGQNLSW